MGVYYCAKVSLLAIFHLFSDTEVKRFKNSELEKLVKSPFEIVFGE